MTSSMTSLNMAADTAVGPPLGTGGRRSELENPSAAEQRRRTGSEWRSQPRPEPAKSRSNGTKSEVFRSGTSVSGGGLILPSRRTSEITQSPLEEFRFVSRDKLGGGVCTSTKKSSSMFVQTEGATGAAEGESDDDDAQHDMTALSVSGSSFRASTSRPEIEGTQEQMVGQISSTNDSTGSGDGKWSSSAGSFSADGPSFRASTSRSGVDGTQLVQTSSTEDATGSFEWQKRRSNATQPDVAASSGDGPSTSRSATSTAVSERTLEHSAAELDSELVSDVALPSSTQQETGNSDNVSDDEDEGGNKYFF